MGYLRFTHDKMKKLIKDWTQGEKRKLINWVEQTLPIWNIKDIQVVGSYVFGGDMKDLDIVVFVEEDIEEFKMNETIDEVPREVFVFHKTQNLHRLFEGAGQTFNLPHYSLYTNEIIGGKEEDIKRWKACKRGGYVEMKGNRVWNGSIPKSNNLKLIPVEGGMGGVLQ